MLSTERTFIVRQLNRPNRSGNSLAKQKSDACDKQHCW